MLLGKTGMYELASGTTGENPFFGDIIKSVERRLRSWRFKRWVSKQGVQPLSWTLDHVGVLSRCARNSKFVLDAISGYDPKDAYSIRLGVMSSDNEACSFMDGLKIGVIKRYFFDADPEIAEVIGQNLALLEEHGAAIIELDLPDLQDAFRAVEITLVRPLQSTKMI